MANNDTSVDNGNGVRIVHVSTFPLARQNLSNGSLPNRPVDVVATNDGFYSVAVHLENFVLPRLVSSTNLTTDCRGRGHRWVRG